MRRPFAGGRVDVAAYLAGEPECFWVRSDADGDNAPARIVVNVSHIWDVTHNAIRNLGAAVAAAAVAASAQRPVLVTAVLSFKSRAKRNTYVTVTTDVDMRAADVGSVAVLLTRPETLRRALFSIGRDVLDLKEEENESFGYDTESEVRARALACGKNDVYVRSLTNLDNDVHTSTWTNRAREWLGKLASVD